MNKIYIYIGIVLLVILLIIVLFKVKSSQNNTDYDLRKLLLSIIGQIMSLIIYFYYN